MNELALFAGAGGGILGGHLLGWRCICAVECNPYAAAVLCARQNDGVLPPFPVWDDVRTFDGTLWRGRVDVVSGGFPCQDISAAGKGGGITGERSGLWVEMARIIGEVLPRYVLVENSPVLTSRGLGRVLGDLATLGYDAQWGVLGADDAGAPHLRKRIWIVAYAGGWRFQEQWPSREVVGTPAEEARSGNQSSFPAECGGEDVEHSEGQRRHPRGLSIGESTPLSKFDLRSEDVANAGGGRCRGPQGREGELTRGAKALYPGEDVANARGGRGPDHELCPGWHESGFCGEEVSDAMCDRLQDRVSRLGSGPGAAREASEASEGSGGSWWESEPCVGRVADGVAARVDRLAALGNGQVPAVAHLAWQILHGMTNQE